MLAVAAVVCSFLLSRDARRHNIDADMIYDFVFWIVVSGIIGARLFYIFLNLEFFINNPQEIIMIQHGGLAFQGGFIFAMLSAVIYIKNKKLPLLSTMDLMAPYAALGHAIGRLGCFLNGCCYGLPWEKGLYFPLHDARLHPTQLYAAFALLVIFFVLKKFRKVTQVPGQVVALYLMLTAVQRFGNEFFRADHVSLYADLSIFQVVSLVIFVLGVVMNLYVVAQYKKAQRPKVNQS
jgi:phosphatidylglycerol:prolipoprotein diacylglycerol transferase